MASFPFLENRASTVAPLLLGCILERTIEGRTIRVKIVETEAYEQTDAASHSYKGRTPRANTMFGPAGHLYVYFTYGMYYCCNIVTGPEGLGEAVLIRAVEPIEGEEWALALRPHPSYALSNGPAKLCQALAIDKRLDGHDLTQAPLRLIAQPPLKPQLITQARRIGIRQVQEVLWRFYITDNPYVSVR